MSIKVKAIYGVVVVFTSFAFGYYTAPFKTKIEVKTVEVEKQTDKKKTDTKDNTKTVKVEERKPDGTVTTTTTTDNNIDTKTSSVDTTSMSSTTDTSKEVSKSGQLVTVSFLVGASLTNGLGPATMVYGGLVSKPVLGPITLSLWGFSDKTLGTGLGLTF